MYCMMGKAIIMISLKKKWLGIFNVPYDEYSHNNVLARKKENNKNKNRSKKIKIKIKKIKK